MGDLAAASATCEVHFDVRSSVLDAHALHQVLHITGSHWEPHFLVQLVWPTGPAPDVLDSWGGAWPVGADKDAGVYKFELNELHEFFAVETKGSLETPRLEIDKRAPCQYATRGDRSGETCVGLQATGMNTRDVTHNHLSPERRPLWCHDIYRQIKLELLYKEKKKCSDLYYQLPDEPDYLVQCKNNIYNDRCIPGEYILPCNAPPPSSPAPVPGWVKWADECTHLLQPPTVEALSSGSFRVTPALKGVETSPKCEFELEVAVEYRPAARTTSANRGTQSWLSVPKFEHISIYSATPSGPGTDPAQRLRGYPLDNPSGSWIVENLVCGGGCEFRVTPTGSAGHSQPSAPLEGKPLPPIPPDAERLEMALWLGFPTPVFDVTAAGGQTRLLADLAVALKLPSADYIKVVEARVAQGHATVVIDLLPTPSLTAPQLVAHLSSLVPIVGSDLYGGLMTQHLDRRRGFPTVVMHYENGRREPHPLDVPPSPPPKLSTGPIDKTLSPPPPPTRAAAAAPPLPPGLSASGLGTGLLAAALITTAIVVVLAVRAVAAGAYSGVDGALERLTLWFERLVRTPQVVDGSGRARHSALPTADPPPPHPHDEDEQQLSSSQYGAATSTFSPPPKASAFVIDDGAGEGGAPPPASPPVDAAGEEDDGALRRARSLIAALKLDGACSIAPAAEAAGVAQQRLEEGAASSTPSAVREPAADRVEYDTPSTGPLTGPPAAATGILHL
jgi:hypothetical protein